MVVAITDSERAALREKELRSWTARDRELELRAFRGEDALREIEETTLHIPQRLESFAAAEVQLQSHGICAHPVDVFLIGVSARDKLWEQRRRVRPGNHPVA